MFGLFNPMNPIGIGLPIAVNVNFGGQQRQNLPRIDVGGIYALSTNGVSLDTTDSQVVYGINPCDYNALPYESLILLTVHADVPTGGEGFSMVIATPSNGTSTTTTSGSTDSTGIKKVSVVDSQGSDVTGADVSGNTQRLLYLNKRTGVARFMEFTASASTDAETTATT